MSFPRPLLCASLLLCFFVGQSQADKWPGRAGGDSASGDPELLLTFDDGPHEKNTRKILDTLEEYGHQAIFFWTGHRVLKDRKGKEERLALVDRAVSSGHLVGNHTISHAKLCTVSRDKAAQEIDEAGQLFEGLTNLPMILFRVPYGARCKRLDAMLVERDLTHLHWDLDPQEFRHHSVDTTVRYVKTRLRRLEDGQRAVLLMHDTQPVTAKALPKILVWIDSENEKRAKRGRRPIRVIEASSWVAENYSQPLFEWGHSSMVAGGRALRSAASQLLLR
jgi:peptidoglycan/xylan/chitin deacetylase (PgdA/CDA1 family)